MPTLEPLVEIVAPLPTSDLLFELQLRVARRADELARGGAPSRSRDWSPWLEAEREVFALQASAAGIPVLEGAA